jgi:hypothetical protein
MNEQAIKRLEDEASAIKSEIKKLEDRTCSTNEKGALDT